MENGKNNGLSDKKALLSILWIFAVLNYLYCDVTSLMDSSLLKQYLVGKVDGMEINQMFLLLAGILMEISISMVLFSKILPYKINRVANMIAATITTLVQIATLFAGKPTMYYLFFSIIEISCTISIFISSLKWHNQDTLTKRNP